MLIDFKNLLVAEGYYAPADMELRLHPDSCCTTITSRVLNFDKIKDDFSAFLGIANKLKSVDAIFLPAGTDELYFIEMTSFRKHAIRTGNSDIRACETFINNDLTGHGLPNKIIDSICIILGFIGRYEILDSFYSYFLDSNRLKIKTLFVLDLTYRESLLLRRAYGDKRQISLTKRIDGEINIMNCGQLDSFLQATPAL